MRYFFTAILLFATFCFATEITDTGKAQTKEKRIQFGISAGDPTPLSIVAGVGYKSAIMRIQGMGWRNGENDYWCAMRGGLSWTFFRELPFNVDLGIGGGYSFAEAPNGMHKALNDANGAMYVLPYNYEETLDLSVEVWVHLYGIYTQISYPVYFFMDHTKPTLLWRAGYMFEI
ncbi:MAG: hypothetical protein J6T62_01675 [Fibrobacter sp.]|nr:hypothetical protein [Fibrobacter sp.]